MTKTFSILGTTLLVGAVALAQTAGSSGKSGTKKDPASTQTSSTTYGSGTSNSSSASTNDSSNTKGVEAGSSGFDASQGSSTNSPSSTAYSSPSSQANSGMGSSDEIANGPVAETVADSNANIGWSTRNAASSTGVKYGTSRVNLSQTAEGTNGADGKNHHARLQGLSPSTRYYFQVTENGQPVGGVGTFKTTAAGETPVQSKAIIPQK